MRFTLIPRSPKAVAIRSWVRGRPSGLPEILVAIACASKEPIQIGRYRSASFSLRITRCWAVGMCIRMLSTETSMRFFILGPTIPFEPLSLRNLISPRAGYDTNVAKGKRGRVVLIDAHSLIYRAFFALPPMSTSDGQVTNAAYGFTSMLAIVLASRPEYAVASFDVGAPTWRSKEYVEYKAGRRAMPDDLRPQIEMVRDILTSFSIPIHGIAGFEADDLIGTFSRLAEERGHSVTIVSGDLDCLQLVSESVEALVPRRGITDTFVYGPDQVRQRYGFEPLQLIDFKALRGDTSDNIPGVPGVGDKTAAKLVQDFGSVEALLERVDELPEGRLKTSLKANADQVRLGKRMVTIVRDVPVDLDLETARWSRYDYDKARAVFDRLEFRQLLSRFPPPDQVPVQPSLSFEAAPEPAGLRVVDDPAEAASLLDGSEVAIYTFNEGAGRSSRICGLGVSTGHQTFYVA